MSNCRIDKRRVVSDVPNITSCFVENRGIQYGPDPNDPEGRFYNRNDDTAVCIVNGVKTRQTYDNCVTNGGSRWYPPSIFDSDKHIITIPQNVTVQSVQPTESAYDKCLADANIAYFPAKNARIAATEAYNAAKANLDKVEREYQSAMAAVTACDALRTEGFGSTGEFWTSTNIIIFILFLAIIVFLTMYTLNRNKPVTGNAEAFKIDSALV